MEKTLNFYYNEYIAYMKKQLLIIVLIVLIALGYTYRAQILQWAKKENPKGLASFSLPKEILDKIGSDASLLPSPLRGETAPIASSLSNVGTFNETNLQRKANNLPPLKNNILLAKAAQMKLTDMFAKQYFEHVSPSGVAPADLDTKVGYTYVLVGENLALGNFKDDKALLEAWMNSPGHRANILNNRYQELGVAVGKGLYEGKETWLAVQEFGTPQSACPGVDANLKKQIDDNQTTITQMQTELTAIKNDLENNKTLTRDEYNQEVQTYNAKVAQFNILIDQTKQMVNTYNAQVNNLNACISK